MERITLNNDKELNEICSYLNRTMDSNTASIVYSEIEDLKNQMIEGFCHFTFKKVNGEIRDAYGTRAADIIEKYDVESKTKSVNKSSGFNGTFAYFDMVKRAWRCFRIDALICLDREFVL